MVATNESHRSSRRTLLKTAGTFGAAAGLSAHLGGTRNAAANSTEAFANVVLPPDIGQSELQVYIRATGHTLRGSMLDYWRANGGAYIYGNPISEPFASDDGYYSQAFERGIFQYRFEFQDTEDPIMRLMPIGYRSLKLDRNETGAAGRRLQGGGDRQSARWQPLSPNSGSAQKAAIEGGFYDEYTGHTVTGAIADWYYRNEGGFYLGSPLSQALKSRGAIIQYFEGGLVVRDAEDVVSLAPLPAETAPVSGSTPPGSTRTICRSTTNHSSWRHRIPTRLAIKLPRAGSGSRSVLDSSSCGPIKGGLRCSAPMSARVSHRT